MKSIPTSTSLSDFKKERVIGKGSFGSVYLVRRLEDNKIYALKTVILDKLNKKEQENSVNEVRILASIHNPFVIGYKEAFLDESNNALNIVMEYADDGDLQTKIKKMRHEGGFFKESLIWEYAIQMIKGLKALHDKKIMHRDLKSANIFLFKKNHLCKLGDMNVSKVIKDKVLLTQTGTPYYASPEVWRDESYSYKSDLWSIGCVIYELCEQHPPFLGKNLDELFEEVCKGKPKRINRIYSDDLWKMIMMLLQTDVNKRADCDTFLNCKLVKEKINEINMKQKLNLNEKNDKENNDNNGKLLNTIKFDNIKDLKNQLPSTKNYENILLDEANKENKNINSNKIKIKNSLIKKVPIIKNKTSRNKLTIKTEENNNEANKKRNNTILEKIKELKMQKDISKFKISLMKKDKKFFLQKQRSKKEIKTEFNLENKISNNKSIGNKSEIFDKNKYLINKAKIKGKIPKTKISINKPLVPTMNIINNVNVITPSIKLYKDNKCSKINYNNQILQSLPVSASLSNINSNNSNNCLSLDMSHDISKQMNCITQTTKNNCNNNINLIPICRRSKKEQKIKTINTKLIKRKNTYTKEKGKKIKIKEKIETGPILIKRNRSLNLDTLKNIKDIKMNKPRHKKNNLSLNSLNINNNIYKNLTKYYRKFNMINNNNNPSQNKISLKKRFQHQRYPTIFSVQYSILNNYKIINANIRNKKGSNHSTLYHNLHKNFITNNNRNIIHYKKLSLNINNNSRRINSFNEKSLEYSDILDKIKHKKIGNYNSKRINNNSKDYNKDINKINNMY